MATKARPGLPQLPRLPRVPQVTAGLAGRQVLRGPKIPVSAEQDEARLARFEVWRATWNGSFPEFIVFEFLTLQKKQRPNVDFVFQSPFFGGRTRFGGFLADFYFVNRREIWRVMGERFHLLQPADRARDNIAKLLLQAQGLRVLDLWEADLLERPLFVLELAWERSAEVKSRAPR